MFQNDFNTKQQIKNCEQHFKTISMQNARQKVYTKLQTTFQNDFNTKRQTKNIHQTANNVSKQ